MSLTSLPSTSPRPTPQRSMSLFPTARTILRGLPALGFFILLGSYLAAGVFFYFGIQTPRLDTAFEILAKRERGAFTAFSEPEIKVLRSVLDDYSGFSRALVGRAPAKFLEPRVNGWVTQAKAHLAVRPEKDQPVRLLLQAQGSPRDFPITVAISDSGVDKTLKFTSNEAVPLEFGPNELKKTKILGVKVTSSGPSFSASTWGLRVLAANPANRETP